MRASTYLAAIAGLCASSCLAATSMPPFEITNVRTHRVQGGNITVSFTVYDPAPITNATQNCSATWVTGSGDYPQGGYTPCANSSFAWNMASYNGNIASFVMAVEHVYEDPAVGDPPYDYITNFAKANVTKPPLQCTAIGGQSSCEQKAGTVISADIYATVAKRR